jgi:hypothetical protein
MTTPGAASSALAGLLDGAQRPARVVGVLGAAAYLEVEGPDREVVALVTRDAVRVPNAVVLPLASADAPFAGVQPGMRATVGAAAVRVGPLTVPLARWWAPARPRIADVRGALARAGEFARLVAAAARPLPGVLTAPVAALRAGLTAGDGDATGRAVLGLLGLGPGLTPSGDDVVAGALVTLRALGAAGAAPDGAARTVVACAHRRTPLISAGLLRHAAQGRCIPPLATTITALGGTAPPAAPLASLLAVGHHSGSDLAHGVALALTAAAGAPGRGAGPSPPPPRGGWRARRSPVAAGSSGGARSRR